MNATNPLSGPGVITAIAAVIAVLVYVRNVPMRQLEDFVKADPRPGTTGEGLAGFEAAKRRAYLKIAFHAASQIGLMVFVTLLSVRALLAVLASQAPVPAPARDFTFYLDRVLAAFAVAVVGAYLLVHCFVDGREIRWALGERAALKGAFTNTGASAPSAPRAEADPQRSGAGGQAQ